MSTHWTPHRFTCSTRIERLKILDGGTSLQRMRECTAICFTDLLVPVELSSFTQHTSALYPWTIPFRAAAAIAAEAAAGAAAAAGRKQLAAAGLWAASRNVVAASTAAAATIPGVVRTLATARPAAPSSRARRKPPLDNLGRGNCGRSCKIPLATYMRRRKTGTNARGTSFCLSGAASAG